MAKKPITFRVDDDVREMIKELAKADQRSAANYLEVLVRAAYEQHQKKSQHALDMQK